VTLPPKSLQAIDAHVPSLTDLLDLSGKVALVTGAGRGVGEAVAGMMAERGAAVAVNDFFLDRATLVAERICGAGGRAYGVRADVTDFADVTSMADEVARELGPVDILVNNAGNGGAEEPALQRAPPFWEEPPEAWDRWVAVNYTGVMFVCRAIVGGMVQRGQGRIITVVSDAGRVGEAELVVYGGAKAGAAGFTRGLAKAVARHGVTANCVALGAMRTPAIEPVLADPVLSERLASAYPVRRIGLPIDAAGLITFLASDAASWITGQTYPVNGGYSLAL
jgi:3-oxoacyl-[acyl-carrier protein] reductase